MSEPAGVDFGRRWIRPEQLLVDAALAGWLAYAGRVFQVTDGNTTPVWFAGLFALAAGVISGVMGLTRDRGRLLGLAAVAAGFVSLAVAGKLAAQLAETTISWAFAGWLAAAAIGLSGLSRLVFRRLELQNPLAEALRWVALLAVATYILLPYYTARSVGAGDATWYALMLADFAEQIRLGVFPVWLGQTEFAFNGAFSPLRLAPWFQHFGGLLDLLTGRSLDYVALKNLVLAVNAVALAFSGYFCLRAVLGHRPTTATVLTLMLLLSPAVLAPLYIGDQYMTFLALPFLPVVCYGLWRAYEYNDLPAHVTLGAGVAGLWLAHSPIALWSSAVAALAYLGKILVHRGRGEAVRLAAGAGVFLVLGAWPLLSALTLKNVGRLGMEVDSIWIQVQRAFPAILHPLSAGLNQPSDYQLGLALMAVLAVALVSMCRRFSWAAAAFAAGVVLLAVFTLPVPLVSRALWNHLPGVVAEITNMWPMQRLMPIGGTLIVFLFAIVFRASSARPVGRILPALFILSLALLGWSQREMVRLHVKARGSILPTAVDQMLLMRHNLTLTRYSYTSFESAPSSFSHGYMDPVLEHRLLRQDRQPLASNLESAARKGALPAPDPVGTALLEHGTLRAVNDNDTTFYNLNPAPSLPANTPLVLWLEPLAPGQPGWLQIRGPGLFREYILPDSGSGINRRGSPRSFGTLPTSTPILPLRQLPGTYDKPPMILIAPQRPIDAGFDFARYELWRYDPAALPISVQSLAPYRLTVRSPEAGYLETPRLWLPGYRALIDGRPVPVERSPDNLAMFAVPAGTSELAIEYAPPLGLRFVYWTGFIGWSALILAGFLWLARRPVSPSNPPASVVSHQ